jgi:hypothetical protein
MEAANSKEMSNTEPQISKEAPWMVTLVQAQLEEMAGVCNELHRANRRIQFIVPIVQTERGVDFERPTSHVAIFSLPNTLQ